MTLTATLEDRTCARHKPTITCIIVPKSGRGPALPALPFIDPRCGHLAHRNCLKPASESLEMPGKSIAPFPGMQDNASGAASASGGRLGARSEIAKQPCTGGQIAVLHPGDPDRAARHRLADLQAHHVGGAGALRRHDGDAETGGDEAGQAAGVVTLEALGRLEAR